MMDERLAVAVKAGGISEMRSNTGIRVNVYNPTPLDLTADITIVYVRRPRTATMLHWLQRAEKATRDTRDGESRWCEYAITADPNQRPEFGTILGQNLYEAGYREGDMVVIVAQPPGRKTR